MTARRVVMVALLVSLVAATGAYADSIEYRGLTDNGGGWFTWHYWYHRSDELTADVSTWTLAPTAGVTWSGGANFWDSGSIGGGGTSDVWTYLGGDDPPQDLYITFDVLSNATNSSIPYEIDTDGGGADYWGNVDGPVPEPATCALMIAGLAVLGARLRRKKG